MGSSREALWFPATREAANDEPFAGTDSSAGQLTRRAGTLTTGPRLPVSGSTRKNRNLSRSAPGAATNEKVRLAPSKFARTTCP